MTRTISKTVLTSLAAVMIGSAVLASPAVAGGSISLTIVPKKEKHAKALQTGLQVYGIVNAVQNGASIKQLGMNNMAGIGQNGADNLGIIHQEGNGHAGTLQQNGNGNAHGLFQFGEGTNADVVQNGNGEVGATVQIGW